MNEQMPKKIHVAWPTLCKIELEDARNTLETILGRVSHRGDEDALVLAMKSAVSAGKEAQEALEQAYGK